MRALAILAMHLTALPALAQTPRFTIDCAGEKCTCPLLSLTAAGVLQVDDADTRRTLPRLIEMRQAGVKLPPLLTRNFIMLSNGDRLALDADAAATLDGNRLQVWPAALLPKLQAKGLNLFAPNVLLLFWSLPEGVDDAEFFIGKLQGEARKHDVVYLRNGDRIEGSLTRVSPKVGCTIMTGGRTVDTPWSKVAGIVFNTDRQARLRTKRTFARVVLADGSRLDLIDLRFEENLRRWVGKTLVGAEVEMAEASVIALEIRQGPAVHLSDLMPSRYEQRPYLGVVGWPLVKDAAVTGAPLRLAENTFEKGLGLHAPCRVVYKLNEAYERFDALIGIDEAIARRGRARLAIEFDGRRIDLNDGKEINCQTPPLEVRLEVRGVREMTLIVDVGTFGDVQAHVNWANARLIKKN